MDKNDFVTGVVVLTIVTGGITVGIHNHQPHPHQEQHSSTPLFSQTQNTTASGSSIITSIRWPNK